MKIKLLSGQDMQELEENINNFIEENNNYIDVVDINFQIPYGNKAFASVTYNNKRFGESMN